MCTTPFFVRMSNFFILAVPEEVVIVARLPFFTRVIFDPPIDVYSFDPSFMASNRISPLTMCLSITFFNASWLSSLESKSKNATFLGAKTVKEPSPFRVSNRPALLAVLPKFFREKDGLTNAASRMLKK